MLLRLLHRSAPAERPYYGPRPRVWQRNGVYDGSYVELGATFFADMEEGQIDITFFPPQSKTGSGYGGYSQYGTGGGNFDASIVNCAL